MKYILVCKYHFTKLTYGHAIPSKEANIVAQELDFIFGLIGYPIAFFHTDIGKEVSSKVVLDMICDLNPMCTTVMGLPHHPSNQGSVKRVNQDFNAVLTSFEQDECDKGNDSNWVVLLLS